MAGLGCELMTEPATTAAPPTEAVLVFRDGIPGFPEHHRFQLIDLVEDGAFQLLQSVDDAELSMVVSVPWLFFPEYTPELSETDQRELGIDSTEDAVVFCPVTVDPEEESAWMNLLGPFVVNTHTLEGRQVVLTEGDHPTRAAIPLG